MLNDALYRRLANLFGTVKVAKAGQPIIWIQDVFGERSIKVVDYGETYRVNCPFCEKFADPDFRHRLWISHAYGTIIRGKRRWGLATCFHNNCLKNEQVFEELRTLISSPGKLPSLRQKSSYDVGYLTYSDLPGSCISISELPLEHKSNVFLRDRGLDVEFIHKNFDVYYCFDSERFPQAIDRLIFPVCYNGKMVCWQGRYIGVPKSKQCPKYYGPSGSPIKSYLYNYDRAKDCEHIVLVEGILDVFQIGISGVALFGKTLSTKQKILLERTQKPLIVFLDPDAKSEANLIAEQLKDQVVKIVIAERDPGKMKKEELNELVPELKA